MTDHDAPEEWTPEGLVDHFCGVHRKMLDRRFAFILGAGASVQSGIPAAGPLARRWVTELHQRLDRDQTPLDAWSASNLGIPAFTLDRSAEFYAQVFMRRFKRSPDEGYADLEDIMQGKDPSFGYSVLAHVLAETRHKLVITTNFDNLVADALSIFTATPPLVCGHESLASFIRVHPRRPVVAKIHRDLLMAPMNTADEVGALNKAWVEPLTKAFSVYTPIVLGYGGNDGSLMGFLRGLPAGTMVGGIYWTYYRPGGPPGKEIRQLVARHGGALIPIEGFDELMLLLSAKLGIPLLDQVIESKAKSRVERYRKRVEELSARLFPRPAAPPEPAPAPEPSSRAPVRGDPSRAPVRRAAEERPPTSPLANVTAKVNAALRSQRAAAVASAPPSQLLHVQADMSGRPANNAAANAAIDPDAERSDAMTSDDLDDLPFDFEDDDALSLPKGPGPNGQPVDAMPAPGHALELRRALRQVAAEVPADSAWTTLMQARSEPDRDRSLALYRAALDRFPGDPQLLYGLAERLSELPTALTIRGAVEALQTMLHDPVAREDPAPHRDLALLRAFQGDMPAANAELGRAWACALKASPRDFRLTHAAPIAVAAGVLARLQERDDTRALSVVRAAVASPRRRRPLPVLVALLERLDAPGRRLYGNLYQMLLGTLTRERVEALEPRFAAVEPASLHPVRPDSLF